MCRSESPPVELLVRHRETSVILPIAARLTDSTVFRILQTSHQLWLVMDNVDSLELRGVPVWQRLEIVFRRLRSRRSRLSETNRCDRQPNSTTQPVFRPNGPPVMRTESVTTGRDDSSPSHWCSNRKTSLHITPYDSCAMRVSIASVEIIGRVRHDIQPSSTYSHSRSTCHTDPCAFSRCEIVSRFIFSTEPNGFGSCSDQ